MIYIRVKNITSNGQPDIETRSAGPDTYTLKPGEGYHVYSPTPFKLSHCGTLFGNTVERTFHPNDLNSFGLTLHHPVHISNIIGLVNMTRFNMGGGGLKTKSTFKDTIQQSDGSLVFQGGDAFLRPGIGYHVFTPQTTIISATV